MFSWYPFTEVGDCCNIAPCIVPGTLDATCGEWCGIWCIGVVSVLAGADDRHDPGSEGLLFAVIPNPLAS